MRKLTIRTFVAVGLMLLIVFLGSLAYRLFVSNMTPMKPMTVETQIVYTKRLLDTPQTFTARVMRAAEETLLISDEVTITYMGTEDRGITLAIVSGKRTRVVER